MSSSIIYQAANGLWNDPEFQENYKLLRLENVRTNLEKIQGDDIDIDFKGLLRAASLFSLVRHKEQNADKFHEASFRIAYVTQKIWADKNSQTSDIAALILNRLGNLPTLKKQFAKGDLVPYLAELEKRVPFSLALELQARYEGNVIRLQGDNNNDGSTSTLEVTDFQKKLWDGLSEPHNLLSFSSPTSSGKTFILQNFLVNEAAISPNKFRAIYLVPTRALISEVSFALRHAFRDKEIEDVEVLSIPGDLENELPDKVIYVFTQERLLSFLANVKKKKLAKIDYVIVDEAQQISERARGILLHQALNWLKYDFVVGKYVFCSPVISNPDIFSAILKTGSDFDHESYLTEISPVTQNLLITEPVKGKPGTLKIYLHDEKGKRVPVFDHFKLDEKWKNTSKAYFLAYCAHHLGGGKRSIIYVDGPAAADSVATELMKMIGAEPPTSDLDDIATYIQTSVHKDFLLSNALKYKIGIHYGKMPSLIRDTVETLFRDKKLDFMICTSTLAQGVNLPAQNLFILDPKVQDQDTKKHNSIPASSFWNIVGRAGRLYKDFEGNVFLLKQPLYKENWEDQYLNFDRLSDVVPAAQTVIVDHRPELIEHILNADKNAQNGIEEAASFIYDLANAGRDFKSELSWLPDINQSVLDELKSTAVNINKEIMLPVEIVRKNVGVSPAKQQALYAFFLGVQNLDDWLLPPVLFASDDKQQFHKIMEKILLILDSPDMDPVIRTKYAWAIVFTSLDWMRGTPLNQMLNAYIKRSPEIKKDTIEKINTLIRTFLGQIETTIRFKTVKHINCYNNIFRQACIDQKQPSLVEKIPEHLPLFLEVGANDPVQLNLISLGLSRMSAVEISARLGAVKVERASDLIPHILRLLSEGELLPKVCADEVRRCLL
ncbi:MAG: hypothetical protein COB59_11505 [Rhodospirillaceae bacterium]|nr:MAG: hypothetical protein COB59_11505 [Rhodospirillaceae bacterium]